MRDHITHACLICQNTGDINNMDKNECKIGMAVDHESGVQGIIINDPWHRKEDNEWFIPVLLTDGRSTDMFPRRLTLHQ